MLRNRLGKLVSNARARGFSTALSEETYPMAMKVMHWTMGIGILGCVTCVKVAQ